MPGPSSSSPTPKRSSPAYRRATGGTHRRRHKALRPADQAADPTSPAPAEPRSPAGSVGAPEPPARQGHGGHVPVLGHLAGLDGLRAIAVAAVVAYHAGTGWLGGGFLGVEVFFVISGYLITALLLAEHAARGRIGLRAFWLRRARRLLPALAFLLVGCLAFAVVVLPDEVARLRADALAAAAYVANWHLVFADQSYFETVGRPSLFLHLWSLGIEEQFYVVWPVVLGVALLAGRRAALALTLVTAAASTVWMALLFVPDVDPSRVYYGTDTRLAGLLLGSALAFAWVPGPGAAAGRWTSRRTARTMDVAAGAGLLGLAAFFVAVDAVEPFLYRGGFALLGLVTLVVIAGAVHPLGRLGRLLDHQPLAWIGTRSYSIYLWHWPVFVVTRPGLDVPLDPLPDLVLRLALTAALAEISYRFVETPIRRGALGRWWQAWRSPSPERVARPALIRWPAPAAGGLAAAGSILLVSVAMATPAQAPDWLDTGPVDGIIVAEPTRSPVVPPSGAPGISPVPLATAVASLPGGVLPTPALHRPWETPAPTAEPLPDILAFGDSVMIPAAKALAKELGTIRMDATIGRQVADGIDTLRAYRDAGELPPIVIVHLGNNGPFRGGQFDQVMAVLDGVEQVIWVNLRVPREWEGRNNRIIAQGAAAYPSAVLVDWHGATESRRELFWKDGYHPRAEGAALYAKLVEAALGRPR